MPMMGDEDAPDENPPVLHPTSVRQGGLVRVVSVGDPPTVRTLLAALPVDGGVRRAGGVVAGAGPLTHDRALHDDGQTLDPRVGRGDGAGPSRPPMARHPREAEVIPKARVINCPTY